MVNQAIQTDSIWFSSGTSKKWLISATGTPLAQILVLAKVSWGGESYHTKISHLQTLKISFKSSKSNLLCSPGIVFKLSATVDKTMNKTEIMARILAENDEFGFSSKSHIFLRRPAQHVTPRNSSPSRSAIASSSRRFSSLEKFRKKFSRIFLTQKPPSLAMLLR